MAQPFGLRQKTSHSSLLITDLEQLNYILRASIGLFSDATEAKTKRQQALGFFADKKKIFP